MVTTTQPFLKTLPPLSGTRAVQEFSAGSKIRLVRISGDRELAKRLESMGLHVGKTVKLVKKHGSAVLLKVDNTRIALRICQNLTVWGEHLAPEVTP